MNYMKETVFQTKKKWSTYELIETMSACTENAQVEARQGSRNERGTWMPIPISYEEAISNWHLLMKENLVFSNGIFLLVQTTLKGRPNSQP